MKILKISTILITWKVSFITFHVIIHGVAEYQNGVG